MVAAQMPDVVFTLTPTGAIRGQVELSTGEPAEGIALTLVRRGIESGRAVWQTQHGTKTNSDGTFRFGGLAEGDYALFNEPAMDNDLDGALGGSGQRWGYPTVYYPDAREPSGAARIHVESGQEIQANLTLTLEPFQSVTAAVLLPPGSCGRAWECCSRLKWWTAVVNNFPILGDTTRRPTRSRPDCPMERIRCWFQAFQLSDRGGGMGNQNAGILAGSIDVTVAGRAVPNLRAGAFARRGPIRCR